MSFAKIHKELEKKVKKDWGERCDEYSFGCPLCMVWRIVDDVKSLADEEDPKKWKKVKK